MWSVLPEECQVHPLSVNVSSTLPVTVHATAAAVSVRLRCPSKPEEEPLRRPQSQGDATAWRGSPQCKSAAQQQVSGPLTRCSPSTAFDS